MAISWLFWTVITGAWIERGVIGISLVTLIIAIRLYWARAKRLKRGAVISSRPYAPKAATIHLSDIQETISTTLPTISGKPNYLKRYFADSEVAAMIATGVAINGNGGGLLIGRSHEQGGIPVLMSLAEGGYKLHAEFEGYEYLLNPGVLSQFQDECVAANQYDLDRSSDFVEYAPLPGITLINVRALNHPAHTKYLVLDGTTSFFIVNKHSTRSRLKLLEQINCRVTYEQWQRWRS